MGATTGEGDERTVVAGTARLRPLPALTAGRVIDERYRIEGVLGEGGSGTVYRVWDQLVGEVVAMKVLNPERARERLWIKRLAREVKVARAIHHPNVCRVLELGCAEGLWFITMALATGGSLREALRAGAGTGARPLAERVADMRALTAGLAAIHVVGITHRDVTPQNVLRMADGRLMLSDFGLAVERDDQTTAMGGTPAYMPPETARGEKADHRSDVFQAGMIMHELLYGSRPTWRAGGSALNVAEPDRRASAAEEEIGRLIAACLDPDPARRPASGVVLAGRLAAAEAARPLPPLLRSLARTGRFVRRHRRAMAAAAAVLGVAGLVRAVQVASRPPFCKGGGELMASVWNPGRGDTVRKAFLGTGKSYAVEAFARTASTLAAYADGWRRMYQEACEATHVRGEQSVETLDLRMTCLQQQRGELEALVNLFTAADDGVVTRAVSAAAALAPSAYCADVQTLRAVVRPPNDPAARARVDAVRQQLAAARALFAAGRLRQAREGAIAVVAAARQLGHDPLTAEALLALGTIEGVPSPHQSKASLEEAMLLAEGARHDRVLGEAAVALVNVLTELGSTGDEVKPIASRCQAIVRRLGGDPRLESWLYTGLGRFYNRHRSFAESLSWHQRALDLKLKILAPDDPDVAKSLGNIAAELHSLGRDPEALAANERALAILTKALGPDHPEVGLHTFNRGEIRMGVGRLDEARQDFERTLAIFGAQLPPGHPYVAEPLTRLGQLALTQGRPTESIDLLERAYAIREASADALPEDRIETASALARALEASGRDPARARRLQAQARELQAAAPIAAAR